MAADSRNTPLELGKRTELRKAIRFICGTK